MANCVMITKKFEGQTWLRLRLDSELTDAEMALVVTWLIKYKKPVTGTLGQVTGTRDGITSAVFYDLLVTDTFIDENGLWNFWLHATLADGRVAPGEVYQERIYQEGVA